MIQLLLALLVAKDILTKQEAEDLFKELDTKPVPHQLEQAFKQVNDAFANIK
jgi:hypothetical protein